MLANVVLCQASFHRETRASHVGEKGQCSVDPLGAMFLFTYETLDSGQCSVDPLDH
jgi:hypothetical protein